MATTSDTVIILLHFFSPDLNRDPRIVRLSRAIFCALEVPETNFIAGPQAGNVHASGPSTSSPSNPNI